VLNITANIHLNRISREIFVPFSCDTCERKRGICVSSRLFNFESGESQIYTFQ